MGHGRERPDRFVRRQINQPITRFGCLMRACIGAVDRLPDKRGLLGLWTVAKLVQYE
jgi:hypothetical protein